jgi:anti-sigma-K factor RskA
MTNHDQFADDLAMLALGELPEDRAAEFRQHIATCPSCQREYDQLQADTALLALSVAGHKPPTRSRDRLLSAIAKEPRVTRMVQLRPRWWALAPVFGAALLALFAILLWVDNNNLRDELDNLQAKVAADRRDLGRAREMLATMTAPDAVHMSLVSTKEKPQSQIRVIYLKRNGNLMFFASNLSAPPEHMAYQMWLIPANGKPPMPAGMFKPDAHGMAQVMMPPLDDAPDAKTFAVTIEKESGSPVPTSPVIMSAQ